MTDILFMDIDGPMIPQRVYYLSKHVPGAVTVFDPVARDHINALLNARPELWIVISSTWRYRGKAKCAALLQQNGIDSSRLHPDWATPENQPTRSAEIRAWLDAHPEIRKYVALDDEILTGLNVAQCTAEDGMVFTAIQQLYMYLEYDRFDPTKDDNDIEANRENTNHFLRFQLKRHDLNNPKLQALAEEMYPHTTPNRIILL